MSFIIAGIHTGIGKTICSAIICQSTGYDYWKPVQAGSLDNSDSIFIQKNVTNPSTKIHPETYRLQTASSPHIAAEIDGIEIKKENIILPKSNNNIVVETAGGLMSPFSKEFFNIDLPILLGLPVILVSNNYLGSINHTLLSVEALQKRNIKIKGIVFSGEKIESTQSFILEHIKLKHLFSIPFLNKINAETIADIASSIDVPTF
jgi:dethiobiotin synthetase